MWWPSERLAVVSDLHFEKGSSLASRGLFLPPTETRSTLNRLSAVLSRLEPQRVIALGDSFHDQGGSSRMAPADQSHLFALASHFNWIWVTGNHDPTPPDGLPGQVVAETCINGLTFRHEAKQAARPGEISGHFHPKARIKTRAKAITRPCFIADQTRLILPAFGALTGGLSVRDPAIARLFTAQAALWLLGQTRITPLPLSATSRR
ncbi:MAG: ligase-associated DNA damage response endonuclease PdeM [Alphaproteobacteria bacterium]